jgi:hypothetical protein
MKDKKIYTPPQKVVWFRCIHAASVISMAKYAIGGLCLGAKSRTGWIPEVLWTAARGWDGRDEGRGRGVWERGMRRDGDMEPS